MADRTTITPKTALGAYGTYGANLADYVPVAADVANGNQFPASGNDLVLVRNSGSGAHTLTIYSSADEYGRTGDITAYSLGAGENGVFGPFKLPGWVQTNGYINVNGDHAELLIAVIKLP